VNADMNTIEVFVDSNRAERIGVVHDVGLDTIETVDADDKAAAVDSGTVDAV
jgi:hypothetical protein